MKRVATDAPAAVLSDAKVRVEGVSKYLLQDGQRFAVLQDVNLYAKAGEFVSLIGPSGCGKSTLLNIIAGLEQPSSGTLYLNGRRAEQRLGMVGYMQQKDLLLPWRNVLDNSILGLELRGVSRRLARARALALMEQFGLKGFETAYPYALSGGMRQRTAFLRTILPEQDVFLLDEPFGALDALNRAQIHSKPEAITRFLRAIRRGYEDAVQDPQAGVDILLKGTKAEVDETIERPGAKLLAPLWQTDKVPFGTQDAARWENFTRWMQANGLLESPVKAEDAFTNRFHGSN